MFLSILFQCQENERESASVKRDGSDYYLSYLGISDGRQAYKLGNAII